MSKHLNQAPAYPHAKTGGPRAELSALIYETAAKAGAKGVSMADLSSATDKTMEQLLGITGNLRGRGGRRVLLYSVRVHSKTVRYFAADVPRFEAEAYCEQLRDEFLANATQRSKMLERARKARYRAAHAETREAARLERLADKAALVAKSKADEAERRRQERQRAELLKRTMKAEQKLNNQLAKQIQGDGTHRKPAERKPAPVTPTVATWDDSIVYREPRRPGRYEVLTAPPTFTGKELLPAAGCAARALS